MAIYYDPEASPEEHLEQLAAHPYPDRVLVVGLTENWGVVGYAITGRSEASQNRRLEKDNGIVGTVVADPTKPSGDPETTIYDAIRPFGSNLVVTNGKHTNAVIDSLRAARTFEDALMSPSWTYEDDSLSTSRIAGMINASLGWASISLAVLSRVPGTEETKRALRTFRPTDFGYRPFMLGIHTYPDGEHPEIPFDEEPFTLPFVSNPQELATLLFERLNQENLVATAAAGIDTRNGKMAPNGGPEVANRYKRANWPLSYPAPVI